MSGELLSRRSIDSVTEREFDLLLLILLHTSPAFRTFLVSKIVGVDRFEFLGFGAVCTAISEKAICWCS
jgi:hypothetical protein